MNRDCVLCTLSIIPKFHTYPHSLLGLSELSVRFHNWNGVYIGILHLGSTRRLQLVLHSLALCDVVTLWVECVFILDRNEGLEVFPEVSYWVNAIFSFFTEWALVMSSSALYGVVLWLGASHVGCSSLLHSLLLLSPCGFSYQSGLFSLLLPYLGVTH